jgi:hypothetical protein
MGLVCSLRTREVGEFAAGIAGKGVFDEHAYQGRQLWNTFFTQH